MLEWSRVRVTRVPGWAAEILAMLCASLGFPTPSCQGDSHISRLNQGVEILDAWDVRMSKFLSNLSLVPRLLPPCSLLTPLQEKYGLHHHRLHIEGRSIGLRSNFCALRHPHAGRW